MAENIKEKKARIRNIVDTTENWKAANPILLSGEIGFEITSDKEIKIKIGDGITTWGLLEYITNTPKELQKKIDTLQSEIDNIVLASTESGDVTAEVVQARVGLDGTSFETLKARFDSIETKHNATSEEVTQARTDLNSKVYGTLKDRLDSEASKMEKAFDSIDTIETANLNDYVVLENCREGKVISFTGMNSDNCYGISVANGYNLMHYSSLYAGETRTLSKGGTLTVDDDLTITYDGTNATDIQEFDIWVNSELKQKYPFDVKVSCEHNVESGGFNVYCYHYNSTQEENVNTIFVNSPLTLPANSKIIRIYAKPNNATAVFSFKLKINKADDVKAYDPPSLKYVGVSDIDNIGFKQGVNILIPNYKSGVVDTATVRYGTNSIGDSIENLSNEVANLSQELEKSTDVKEIVLGSYVLLEDCKERKVVEFNGLNDSNCYGVSVTNSHNLMHYSTLYAGEERTLTKGGILTVSDDLTITYDGTNATDIQEIDIWSNGELKLKYPFDVQISCEFTAESGGFKIYCYYTDSSTGTAKNTEFTSSAISVLAKSTILRIYAKPTEATSAFSLKVKINKADDIKPYDPPSLKYVGVSNIDNIELKRGLNYIIPSYMNGEVETATVKYLYDTNATELATLMESVTEMNQELEKINDDVVEVKLGEYVVLEKCRKKNVISFEGLDSTNCYGVAVANGYNLMHYSSLYAGETRTLSKGGILTVADDLTITYDGTNATDVQEFDIWVNSELKQKYPFDVQISCGFTAESGGFKIYCYYIDSSTGTATNTEFTSSAISVLENSAIIRIYAKPTEATSAFSLKVKINKADDIKPYDPPSLKYVGVSDIDNIGFKQGVNILIPNYKSGVVDTATVRYGTNSIGDSIENLSNEVANLSQELEKSTDVKEIVLGSYVLLEDCKERKVVEFNGLNDSNCYGVAVTNSHNLMHYSTLYAGEERTLTKGGILTVSDDLTITYDGTNATDVQEFDIWVNSELKQKYPFDVEISCEFTAESGGFKIYCYYIDSSTGTATNTEFTSSAISVLENSAIIRIYAKPTEATSAFSLKVKINKADDIKPYDPPSLKYIGIGDIDNIELKRGLNYIIPNYNGEVETATVKYCYDTNATELATLMESVTEMNQELEKINDDVVEVKLGEYVVLEKCRKKNVISFEGLDSTNCYGVAVANGYNLMHYSSLYAGETRTLSKGGILTVDDDLTITYDGTNATDLQEIDVWSNGELKQKYPFDVKVSCIYTTAEGGFTVWCYYYDSVQGKNVNEAFTGTALTLPANSKIIRIYAKSTSAASVFSFKVKINKSDETKGYDVPSLKYISIGDIGNIILGQGVNTIIPNYKNGVVDTATIKYATKEEEIDGFYETKKNHPTINSAMIASNNQGVVYINAGTYTERIEGRGTPKYLLGVDKEVVKIIGDSDDYDNPPIEMSHGLLKNITVIETNAQGAYCLHVDNNATENQTLIIENCRFDCERGIPVGLGTRAGAKLLFKNCEFIRSTASDGNTGYTFYMHNTESTGTTPSEIVFDNCRFVTDGECTMKLQDWTNCCPVIFTFINNCFYSKTADSSASVVLEYRRYNDTDIETSQIFKNKFTLSSASYGNNVPYLNYTSETE